MIAFLPVLLASALTIEPPSAPFCRGVAVQTESGPANFISIYAEGDDEALLRFKSAALALHFQVVGPSVGIFGRIRVSVGFQTVRNSPSDMTNPDDALNLLHRAEQGEFGQLRIRPLMMSIDTLPRDRC